MKPKAAELRKLIGKKVKYKAIHRCCIDRVGLIEEVRGKNVRIDGDWFYFGCNNDIEDIEVIEDAKTE